jgi:hypothetical protein
MGGEA